MTAASAARFSLPARLEAREPPEARGLARDDVRMLVATRRAGALADARFGDLPQRLRAGDVVVVNTSATLPAALPAAGGVTLHLSTPVPGDDSGIRWVVELRRDGAPFAGGAEGEALALAGGGSALLLARHLGGQRLWVADLRVPGPLLGYLDRHGSPIRYRHAAPRPLADLQTVYAGEPGSAEMPSAGRPFTPAVLAALAARGITVAPLVLHTGVSSLESHEAPYPERYRVPAETARLVTEARELGGRVIAVGTSVVRALETVSARGGAVHAGAGWTRLVVTPERGVRAVDGLLTGWHDPDASHLLMLEAVAGPELVERSYAAALERGYLWHEFGDVHLILP